MAPAQPLPTLLFSIDTEEFYAVDGEAPPGRSFQELVSVYLELLGERAMRATFFVVGEFARRHPQVVAAIHAAGHEIACHGDRHLSLDGMTPDSFLRDLRSNMDCLEQIVGAPVVGFRAPLFSVTAATAWAYPAMREARILYSSSVLPAANPISGWPGFGDDVRSMDGVVEIPMTTVGLAGRSPIPVYGGTYFRLLPGWLIRRLARRQRSPHITSYFHPYDIDHRQRWRMSRGVHGSAVLNAMLFLRRKSTAARIRSLLRMFPSSLTYGEYAALHAHRTGSPNGERQPH